MSEFVYRIAEQNDIEQILKLGNLLADFEITDSKHFFWSEDTLRKCINNPSSGVILCVITENELAGYAIVQYNIAFSTAIIDQMFILPKYRNFGLGKKLYKMILENSKQNDIREICINVEFNNKSIIDFFEHNGFDKTLNNVNLKLELN